LGCGAAGGGFTSDNVTPMNLINIRKVGYGVRQLKDISKGVQMGEVVETSGTRCSDNQSSIESTHDLIELLEKLLKELK